MTYSPFTLIIILIILLLILALLLLLMLHMSLLHLQLALYFAKVLSEVFHRLSTNIQVNFCNNNRLMRRIREGMIA